MLDPTGVVMTWNTGAERIKGYRAEEIIGRNFDCFYTPEDRAHGRPREALETALREGKYEGEHLRVRKDGSRFWAHVVIDPLLEKDGRLVGFVKMTRDVTEHVRAREELERTRQALVQAQKLEAVGQLAGGIAHDLNNVLTTVIGNLDMFQRRARIEEAPTRELLAAAMRGAESGASLVAKLLAFALRQIFQPAVMDLNKLVVDLSSLLRSALGEAAQLKVVLATDLWRTSVDPNLVENALLNLVINSRDAMPGGGVVTIETGNVSLDDRRARTHHMAPGQYVRLVVTDTGHGMDDATRARAFDPFFTTKPPGRGSGLGLSQVYGLVKQSGGHITLESESGRGTTIKLYLPRVVADETAEPTPPRSPGAAPAGHELVVIVEDHEQVRALTRGYLTELGYRVLDAGDATAALRLIEQHEDISLLLTDMVLPDMNGRLLAEEARHRRPAIKVLFTSGYAQNEIVHHGRIDPGVHFIAKPFKLDSLGRRVREVLDQE
jgi:PAS domain S-box-containing protein